MSTAPETSALSDAGRAVPAAALTTQSDRDCPVCGEGGDTRVFAEARIDQSKLDSYAFASRKTPEFMHHRLVECRRCDLVYADPAPTSASLGSAYLDADFDSANEARHASRTYGRIVDTIISRLPCRNGVLDIGTGDGSFLAELLDRGFSDVVGVEPSRAPIAAAEPRVRPLIRHGVFDGASREPDSLSLATCFQTIEHLHDPMTFCTQAMAMLRPGGALLIVAHNRRALSARILGRRSPIFDVEHLQLFSPYSASAMLSRAGFVDVSVRTIVNRYPLSYWIRLTPLPRPLKDLLIRAVTATQLPLAIPLRAGNMAVVGFRPRTAAC